MASVQNFPNLTKEKNILHDNSQGVGSNQTIRRPDWQKQKKTSVDVTTLDQQEHN